MSATTARWRLQTALALLTLGLSGVSAARSAATNEIPALAETTISEGDEFSPDPGEAATTAATPEAHTETVTAQGVESAEGTAPAPPIAADAAPLPGTTATLSDAAISEDEQNQLFCRSAPLLVQVTLAGTDRGVQLAFQTAEGLWLAERTLLASEAGYVAEQQDCDGDRFVRLRPEINFRLDRLTLSVDIDPNFSLLPRGDTTVSVRRPDFSTSTPLARLSYDVNGDVNVRTPSVRQSGRFEAEYLQGPFRVQGSYFEGVSAGSFAQSVGVRADAQLTSDTSVGVFAETGSRADSTAFGLRAATASNLNWELDPIEVFLAVDSDVEVLLDGETVQTFRAPAGRRVIHGLRPLYALGTAVVRWQEGGVTRTVSRPYEFPSPFRPGSFSASAEAGLTLGVGFTAQANARVLVTPSLDVRGDVQTRGGGGRATVSSNFAQGPHLAGLGVTLDWRTPSAQQQVFARYGYSTGRVSVGLAGTLVANNTPLSFVGVDGRYTDGIVGVSGQVVYRFDSTLSARASVDWRVTDTFSTAAFAEVQAGRYRVGVRGRYALDDRSQLSASASASEQGAQAAVEYSTRLDNDQLRILYSTPLDASAVYDFNRSAVSGSISASTAGNLAASVRGGLVYVGGQLDASLANDGAAVLLRTGIPNIPISVNGGRRGTTNALGDIVLTGLNAKMGAQISVDIDQLPIELSVRSPSVSIYIDRLGVYDYDWSENFVRSRWLRLLWAPGEVAAYGVLELPGGAVYYADEEGLLLLPPQAGNVNGVLRTEDGRRRCAVTVDNQTGEVTCGK